MSEHLTERQILECVAGTATAARPRHLEQCARCAAEVERLNGAVRGFAAAVDQAPVPPAPRLDWAEAVRFHPAPPAWRLAMAALALVLVAIPLMFRFHFPPRNGNEIAAIHQQQLERERADAALLEQVESAVSRPVPQPIEPLVQLVAWGSNTNSGVTE
jgi:anti-sigma factor RsiW